MALIGAGHSVGKCHGACPKGGGKPSKENPISPWKGDHLINIIIKNNAPGVVVVSSPKSIKFNPPVPSNPGQTIKSSQVFSNDYYFLLLKRCLWIWKGKRCLHQWF